jgi:hypothetical protein
MPRYRVEQNVGKFPGGGGTIVQASDIVHQKSIFTLIIDHVLISDPIDPTIFKRGYMAKVMAGGITDDSRPIVFGDSEDQYQWTKGIGMMMLERKVEQLNGCAVPAI